MAAAADSEAGSPVHLPVPAPPGTMAFAVAPEGRVLWWSGHFGRFGGEAPSLEHLLAAARIDPDTWARVQHSRQPLPTPGGWLQHHLLTGPGGGSLHLYTLSFWPAVPLAGDPEPAPSGAMASLLGESLAMRAARELAARAARTDAPVLLLGETGVGKELFARAVHELSNRSGSPFIALNCAAVPEAMAEAEFFGYDRGAFTGAAPEGKPGYVERAHGGSLFLDEVAELTAAIQAKLLRALQEGEVERVGGRRPIQVNARILAATNQNLRQLVTDGRFRSDLYFRINVLQIRIPPLRERQEDIPLLLAHYLGSFARKWALPEKTLDPAALALLKGYHWPGNVRELVSLCQRLTVLVPERAVGPEEVRRLLDDSAAEGAGPGEAAAATPAPVPGTLSDQVAELERQLIAGALARAKGNKAIAAQILGINRSTLYEKLRRYSLE